jgi:ribosomal protein L21E
MEKSYNRNVRIRTFKVGDLVLKKVEVSKHVGKLQPNWEGPFVIVEVGRKGSYKIAHPDGEVLPRAWNAINLRRYYGR